jgi:trans-2,3-dihydro-3-hydroxyanthranilate isomerase
MLSYLHYDVFTGTPFEGNQLAVFPAPSGLETAQMQRIAQEMAFSESTFIFPPERGGDVRMRIFTPAEELPLAGHPTIGSTFALAEIGRIAPGRDQFVFELGVGPTPVSLEWKGNALAFAWMTQPLPTFGAAIENRQGLAAGLGITTNDLAEDLPAQMVSCGVPFLFVALTSRAAVDMVSIDRKGLARCAAAAGLPELPVFVFTLEGAGSEAVYSRMLAPGFGIAEDPATGGAAGPLGCYLLEHGAVTPQAAANLVNLQGVAMRRPSRIHISLENRDGALTRVRVGGKAVLVGRGELTAAVPVSTAVSGATQGS